VVNLSNLNPFLSPWPGPAPPLPLTLLSPHNLPPVYTVACIDDIIAPQVFPVYRGVYSMADRKYIFSCGLVLGKAENKQLLLDAVVFFVEKQRKQSFVTWSHLLEFVIFDSCNSTMVLLNSTI
jgi:hypothetical protein